MHLNVSPHSKKDGLVQGIALFEGVEASDLHRLANLRHHEVDWDGDVAHWIPALPVEQPQFDAPLVVDLADHCRAGGVELVLELGTAAVGLAGCVWGITTIRLTRKAVAVSDSL